jgi:hypothetical protein
MNKQLFSVLLVTACANAHANKPLAAHIRRPDLYEVTPIDDDMLNVAPEFSFEDAPTPYQAGLHPKLKKFS